MRAYQFGFAVLLLLQIPGLLYYLHRRFRTRPRAIQTIR